MISYLRPTHTSRDLETLLGWFLAATTPPWWHEAVVEAVEVADHPRIRVHSPEFPDEPYLRCHEVVGLLAMYTGERSQALRVEFRRGQGTVLTWHQSLSNEELLGHAPSHGRRITLGDQKDWIRRFVYLFDEALYGFSPEHVAAQVSPADMHLLCDIGLPVECGPDFWFASEYGTLLPMSRFSPYICSTVPNVAEFAVLGAHGGHPVCLTEGGAVVLVDTSKWSTTKINSGLRELLLSILAWERLRGQPKRLLKELEQADALIRREPTGFWADQVDMLNDI